MQYFIFLYFLVESSYCSSQSRKFFLNFTDHRSTKAVIVCSILGCGCCLIKQGCELAFLELVLLEQGFSPLATLINVAFNSKKYLASIVGWRTVEVEVPCILKVAKVEKPCSKRSFSKALSRKTCCCFYGPLFNQKSNCLPGKVSLTNMKAESWLTRLGDFQLQTLVSDAVLCYTLHGFSPSIHVFAIMQYLCGFLFIILNTKCGTRWTSCQSQYSFFYILILQTQQGAY